MNETRPKLILHAGLHKTGTTAVQKFAALNRQGLRRRGLLYPTYRRFSLKHNESHLAWAHGLSDPPVRLSLELPSMVRRWRKTAVRQHVDVLLSAEALARHVVDGEKDEWKQRRIGYLERVAELLEGFFVEPVIVLRRQDQFVDSNYREVVMRGNKEGLLPFQEYLARKREGTLRFYANLRAFEKVFGRVRVLVYTDLNGGDGLINNFFDALGVDVRGLKEVGQVRRSLSAEQTLAKRYLNKISTHRNRQLLALVQSEEVTALLKEQLPANVGFWESSDQRREFLLGYERDNRRILRRWFPDREELFEPVDEPDTAVVELPTVVERALRDMAERL